MRKEKNMKVNLGARLIGAFMTVAVIAAVLGTVAYFNQRQMTGVVDEIYNRNVRGLDRAADLSFAATLHYDGILTHGFERTEALMNREEENISAARERFNERFARYESVAPTERERELLNRLDGAWQNYLSVAQRILEESDDGLTDALADLIVGELKPAYVDVRNVTEQLVTFNREAGQADYNTAMSQAGASQLEILIIALVSVLAALALGIIASRSISRPVKLMRTRAVAIADGDIDQEDISLKRSDEIGELAEAFNRMVAALNKKTAELDRIAKGDLDFTVEVLSERDTFGRALVQMRSQLNEVLAQVSESVEQVSAGADQVSSASQNLSQGATEQASSLEQITSSMVELSSQATQNTSNASGANSLAREARSQAEDGDKQMQKLVEHMRSIDASSDEIKKIITVIDDIAFQINLLALNANVEAARAGQHGRGFAVVADEVRNLAVRSANSVKETSEKIEESISTIQTGNEIADETARQFREIVGGVTKVADLMEEVSAASQEQSNGLEQINSAVEQIDQVTQSNTASAEQTASAAEQLSSQARALQDQTRRFTLKREAAAIAAPAGGGAGSQSDGSADGGFDLSRLTPEMIEYLQGQLQKSRAAGNRTGTPARTTQTAGSAAGGAGSHAGASARGGGAASAQRSEVSAGRSSVKGAGGESGGETAESTRSQEKGIRLSLEDDEFDEF
jgi:methyl-accepting chemotaxis protein